MTDRGTVHTVTAGEGPPLLLLHGFPETHLMWHATAPLLTDRFSVVVCDLPGYGDSEYPEPAEDHLPHAKRTLARDLIQVMASFGHERFAVAGHDRGGRVGYRMALDHPGGGHPAGGAGHRADGRGLGARQRSLRAAVLALAVPRPARAAGGGDAARRSAGDVLLAPLRPGPRPPSRLPDRDRRRLSGPDRQPRGGAVDVRGLPRRGVDRPRARRLRPRRGPADRVPAARAVGRARARCRSSTTMCSPCGATGCATPHS